MDDKACQSQSVREIAALFGIRAVSCQPVRSIYRVTNGLGCTYAIKPFRQGLSALKLLVHLHHRAEQNSSVFLPALRPTTDGLSFLTYHGTHYLCLSWIHGRELDYLSMADRKRAVLAVELWRKTVERSAVPMALRRWTKRSEIWEKQICEMERCRRMAEKEQTAFGWLYLRDWDFFYASAIAAYEALDRCAYRQYAEASREQGEVFHGDWAHHNLLLRPGGQMVMLDLEYLQGDLQLLNGVDLLMRLLQLDGGDCRIIPFFFDWYNQNRRLSPEDKKIFLLLIGWPTDFWMLGRQYYIERLPRSEIFSILRYQRKVPSPIRWNSWMNGVSEALGLPREKGWSF